MTKAAYSVGIDLGTTHTVVAYSAAAGSDRTISLFAIDQLVAPGEVAALPLLPSLRYHPAPGELAAGDTDLPWPGRDDGESGHGGDAVVGTLARELGARVPGRLVTSAKSWLSHGAVDRLAAILPWGAADDVPRVSPVAASASYLAHLRSAWNQRQPQHPLEAQELVLTVPASFDDAARELTLAAARDAGLPSLRLLEEPQAALYDWLFRHRDRLADSLGPAKLVLICDVGGGTTDLSLVRVEQQRGGEPTLERLAVGSHLMLGGDNMDLALAHRVESRLGGARLGTGQLAQLVERCRQAKEKLLAVDAPASAPVTLLGSGSRLVGGTRSVELGRDEVRQIVVDGFFPLVGADESPKRSRGSALVAFGLPYASDAAVTRHLAAFLQQQSASGWPDALLLNGGVFHAAAIRDRLHDQLAQWRGAPLQSLHNADPDVAVARGAVAYALARRGLAPRIASGSPRSYFLPLDGAGTDAVCLMPRGSEEGSEVRLDGRRFVLRTGEPVRFHLVSTTDDRTASAGDRVDLGDRTTQPLPPIATVVRADDSAAKREIAVELAAVLTEFGTLRLHCIAADDALQRWQLDFHLRGDAGAEAAGLPPRFSDAVASIDAVFGARKSDAAPKAVKQLRSRLETLLGDRERWPTALLRPLFDALWQRARGRRRSADHERVWLSLAGWCLRPGYGDALDGWRIEQLWPIFEQGVQHGRDTQVGAEWWTLWRRVAGGLDETAQMRLLQDFAIVLRGDEAGITERPPRLVTGSRDEMVRLGASLEHIAAEHKAEIGDWLVGQLRPDDPTQQRREIWMLWAIGRLGARTPLYGSVHAVVGPDKANEWLATLLTLDWKRRDGAAAAAASLARVSGDRVRDLPPASRQAVVDRLVAVQAPPAWVDRVSHFVAIDEAERSVAFGESLPPGLRLLN